MVSAGPVYQVPFVYPLSVHVQMKFGRISYPGAGRGPVPNGHELFTAQFFPPSRLHVRARCATPISKIYHENRPRFEHDRIPKLASTIASALRSDSPMHLPLATDYHSIADEKICFVFLLAIFSVDRTGSTRGRFSKGAALNIERPAY